ncbi:hypothetical protein [Saccharopolyspora elongata]|uniref:WXG100 family type VII secretion target n=1 Tax=Saccharopolyspora elongata TaxID=2530387 RepID=A0A4R4YE65_9PSEU|nr:hypothetical protein [Saccharopolyspora elongata]TDD42214.1 hypothetical protein E1288_30265 [Saccharopolyspora elongata]
MAGSAADADDVPGDVDAAVRALSGADPHSFYDAAQRFERTDARLRSVSEQFRSRLRHLEQAWQGPGFEMFAQSADRLLNRVEQVVGVLAEPSYAGLLNELGDALAEAKREVADARSQRTGDGLPADPGVRAEQDARAQEVLRRLAGFYQSTGRRFRAPPAQQSHVPGGSGQAVNASFHGGDGTVGPTSADGGGAGSGGENQPAEPGQLPPDGAGDSGVDSAAGSSADGSSADEGPGEGSAGSIWSSVLPTVALPAAAVLGKNRRSRKKQGRQERDDESEEGRNSSAERDDKHSSADYRKQKDSERRSHDSGQEEEIAGNNAPNRRTHHNMSTSDVQSEPGSQRDSARDGVDRMPETAPSARTDTAVAQPSAVQTAHTPASVATAAAIGASRFFPGSATAPPPPSPTGLRSDGSALTAPVETGPGPAGQPGAGPAMQGAGGPQGGMPPMNPRTMGGPGQKEQQEPGHQERERNVAEREDPSTWQVGTGYPGALGRAHPEREKEDT